MFLLMGGMTSSVIGKEQLLVGHEWIWEGSELLTLTLPPCPLLHTHPHEKKTKPAQKNAAPAAPVLEYQNQGPACGGVRTSVIFCGLLFFW